MLLFNLAFDHRNSYRTDFFGLQGPLSAADEERCRDGKRIALLGLQRAMQVGLPEGAAGLLVDEEHGAEVAVQARQAGIVVAVPLERSGQRELAFEYEPFWGPIARLDPTYAKVLVRYNPEGDVAMNRRQLQGLHLLQAWLSDHGKALMLELLVPPEAQHLAGHGGRTAYDRLLRPELTRRAVQEMVEDGLAPQLWKLEGLETTAEYSAVAEAAGISGPGGAGCLVLGRGADQEAVERWLRLAAPLPTFVGFAIGRTLWWDPLRSYFGGQATEEAAASSIARRYLQLVDVYLQAREHGGES